MGVSFAAIFLRHALPPAACKIDILCRYTIANQPSFAFVEYEDKRDADDAYHEMHNKRIGRDDMLKIEVSPTHTYALPGLYLQVNSGQERPLLPHGALSQAENVSVAVLVHPVVVDPHHLDVARVIILLARKRDATATASTTATAEETAIDLAALITGTSTKAP